MEHLHPEIIDQLRAMARNGDSVPHMLQQLARRLGPQTPSVLTLAKYLRAAFGLSLLDVKPLGGWSADGTGELSDSQVSELILPEIMRHRREWDHKIGA
jgi:hypothetical protein